MILVKFLGYYSEVVGEREIRLPLKEVRIADIVSKYGIPEEEVIVLINGRPAKLGYKAVEGDVVVITPPIGGG